MSQSIRFIRSPVEASDALEGGLQTEEADPAKVAEPTATLARIANRSYQADDVAPSAAIFRRRVNGFWGPPVSGPAGRRGRAGSSRENDVPVRRREAQSGAQQTGNDSCGAGAGARGVRPERRRADGPEMLAADDDHEDRRGCRGSGLALWFGVPRLCRPLPVRLPQRQRAGLAWLPHRLSLCQCCFVPLGSLALLLFACGVIAPQARLFPDGSKMTEWAGSTERIDPPA